MKRKNLSAFTLRAIEITGGAADFRNDRAPTWDGRTWHLARVKTEEHVLHEIAHWIVAPEAARLVTNFGLGTDPDDGPFVLPNPIPYAQTAAVCRNLLELAHSSPSTLTSIIAEKCDHEEALASLVTIILLRHAGLAWSARARKLFTSKGDESFWLRVHQLTGRGVDLEDPLRPFRRAAEGAAA